jgi:hypothetical protein
MNIFLQVHILFPNENTTGTQCIDGFILITPRLKRRRHRIEANTDLKLHGFYKKETPITKVEVLLMDHQPVSMEYNIIPDPELVYEEEVSTPSNRTHFIYLFVLCPRVWCQGLCLDIRAHTSCLSIQCSLLT